MATGIHELKNFIPTKTVGCQCHQFPKANQPRENKSSSKEPATLITTGQPKILITVYNMTTLKICIAKVFLGVTLAMVIRMAIVFVVGVKHNMTMTAKAIIGID